MNYLDVYYRALIDYRKNTKNDRDCVNQCSTTAKANAKKDEIVVRRQLCDIETDWIEAIEEGLVHVDKAIREDRQFIRSNGEIVEIEKVKSVSKDSVEHLARHSNLITRYEEGEDVIPDRLYTVERLSDYAVYENKFLYMLLCYLRDFITMRYNKILDLEHTYNGRMAMNKNIVMPKRKINVSISLDEERKDDPYLKAQSESLGVINRIRNILELTHAYLATPLMQEVSKVPMLKPPVTKTNVLRMNHNFRGALALYEYISAYNRDGFTVREKIQKINPFRLDMADEFAEVILLSSFLTYEYGLDLKDTFRKEYDEEEERRKQEEITRHLEQLKAMRRRIKELGESPDEYILALEKINKELEPNVEKLKIAKQEIDNLNNLVNELRTKTLVLSNQVLTLKNDIEALKVKHLEQLQKLEQEHQEAIQSLTDEYNQQIEILNQEHSEKIKQICDDFNEQIKQICDDYDNRIIDLKTQIEEERINHDRAMQDARNAYDEQVKALEERHAITVNSINENWQNENNRLGIICQERQQKIGELELEKVKLEDARRLSEARLIAIRKEHGLISPVNDFTTEAAFEELEHQLDVFEAFFNEEWKKVKKSIRKNLIKEFFDNIKFAKKRRNSPDGLADKKAKIDKNKQESQKNTNKKTKDVPTENKPTGNKPNENKPNENKPVGNQKAVEQTTENKTTENKIVDNQTNKNKPTQPQTVTEEKNDVNNTKEIDADEQE